MHWAQCDDSAYAGHVDARLSLARADAVHPYAVGDAGRSRPQTSRVETLEYVPLSLLLSAVDLLP